MMFLGIDPGLSGAIAILTDGAIVTHDMPTHDVKGKARLDLYGLAQLLAERGRGATAAYIERVGAMPGQGVSSMFRFGESYGAAQMALAAAGIPIRYVQPAAWKRHFNLTADKDAARQRASEMFPAAVAQWRFKKNAGRAEAALIALYGSRIEVRG